MASVTLSAVEKVYDTTRVVHGVDLSIEDGEFAVLVGPSGCGKSTLLRMVAGLESISGGEIRIGDRPVNDVAPKDRDVAMVFQNYALYPHKTVYQNMAFSLKLRRADKAHIDTQVRNAARILGLDTLLDRYPRQLSGGQRQRVAMGRAIVRDPQVFLFDEPLSNLDAKLRVQMRTEIKSLHEELRTTSIYVTHDQVEAMTMADKITVLRDGVIEQVGAPLDLYDFPANAFVAGFIGSPAMNLLSGRLSREADNVKAVTPEGMALPLPTGAVGEDGLDIFYGVRPEHLSVAAPDDPHGIEGVVDVVEPLGSETMLFARLGTERVCALSKDRLSLAHGAPVWLRPDLDHVHLFDRKGGARL